MIRAAQARRFAHAVLLSTAVTVLAGCSASRADTDRQPGSHGVPLECPPGQPNQTLSPFERCILEYYRPCRIEISVADPRRYELEYTAEGRLASEVERIAGATVTYAYEGGQLVSQRGAGAVRLDSSFEYDADGRLSREILFSGAGEITYLWDGSTLTVHDVSRGSTTTFRFADGRLVEVLFGPDDRITLRTSFHYENGFLVERRVESVDGGLVERREYTYEAGLVTVSHITDPELPELRYEYDDEDRLVRAAGYWPPLSGPAEISLTYACE